MSREQRTERRALGVSAAASASVGVVAVVWGLSVQSQALLLDGVYALIGMGLSLLTLHAARLVAAGPTPRYPFGREALAPLMLGVQGLVLLGTLLYASIDALLTIRAGGSDAAVGSALLYAVASLVLSVVLVVALGRGNSSELVGAEVAQWKAGAVLSGVLAIGFALAVALTRLDAGAVVGYVDPLLVLAAAALLVATPVRMVRTSLRELLEASPDASVTGPIEATVAALGDELGLPEPALRIGKLGRKTYIELDYVVEAGVWKVGDADLVRRALIERLSQPGRLLWVNVELHTDPDWDH